MPVVSFPVGLSEEGLPLAVQFAARRWHEEELFRAAALEGRKRTAQHVIHAVVGPRFLDRENIVRFFDDADGSFITARPGAIEARIGIGDVVARGAGLDLLLGFTNRVGKC